MTDEPQTAVIIVDHGSRRAESNVMLETAVQMFAARSRYAIVEAAHMELAQPDIATAFERCVRQGAQRVIVFPYFLSPGRHWNEDIPRLVRAAAAQHPTVDWMVTAPFGLHPGMQQIINDRIEHCLKVCAGTADRSQCDACADGGGCSLIPGDAGAQPG